LYPSLPEEEAQTSVAVALEADIAELIQVVGGSLRCPRDISTEHAGCFLACWVRYPTMPSLPPASSAAWMIASLSSPLAGLVGDARLAPRTGFATADLIEAFDVFRCLFFNEIEHGK
jgi:hypothetical protein